MRKRVDVGDGLDRIRNRGKAKNMPSIMPRIRLSLSINYKKRDICFRLFDLIRGYSSRALAMVDDTNIIIYNDVI